MAQLPIQVPKTLSVFHPLAHETLSVAATRVSNPDCSPAGIHGCDTAPTPSGFTEIVSYARV
jgi:hypothetical protein